MKIVDYPDLVKQWHPKNGKLILCNISGGRKVWWVDEFGHEWEARIADRINGNNCPYCSGRKVCKDNCLATTHPKIAKLWHPTKNGALTSYDITFGSNKEAWFKCCVENDHEWKTKISVLVANSEKYNGSGCPCCGGVKIILSNCLATTHPELAKQWHPTKNGKLTPFDVVAGHNKKVWWKCPVAADHEWESSPNSRTNNKSGCPCCSGRKVCKDNCLATAHPEIAKEWNFVKNGALTPQDVTAGSSKSVWWVDAIGHEWKARVINRTNGGNGCPTCNKSKLEKETALILTRLNKRYKYNKPFKGCKDKVALRFDFCVWKNNVPYFIECQGVQHYNPKSFGSKRKNAGRLNLKNIKRRDEIKRKFCKENNYPLLEIPYWEFENIEKLIVEFLTKHKEKK